MPRWLVPAFSALMLAATAACHPAPSSAPLPPDPEVARADARALHEQALDLSQEEHTDDAIAKWRQAIELDPELKVAYLELGYALSQAGRHVAAIELMDRVTARWPEDPTGWIELGHIHLARRAPDDALAAFERAKQLDPKSRKAQRGLVESHLKRGDCAQAKQEFKRLDAMSNKPYPLLGPKVARCVEP